MSSSSWSDNIRGVHKASMNHGKVGGKEMVTKVLVRRCIMSNHENERIVQCNKLIQEISSSILQQTRCA